MQFRPPDRNSLALALLRVAVGAVFLIFAEYKIFEPAFTRGGGFQMWIHLFLNDRAAYPFMVPVLNGFVLAHATAIASLVVYRELAIGLALVLGILVRPASICGIVYMLTLLFSSNYPGPHAELWQYFGASLDHSIFAFCFAAFAIGRPESLLSLGAFLRRKKASAAQELR